MRRRGALALRLALMADPGLAIERGLETVRRARLERAADPALAQRVDAVKRYQHRRFENDYADLLASERYGPAARFFLDDLYGPVDYSARDAQFARIVPALRRLLPRELLATVVQLIELHALSEELDHAMARRVPVGIELDDRAYRSTWQQVGRRADRALQVDLTLAVGRALNQHAHKPLLGTTLRLMHGPAQAAGLGQLQSFLQRGLAAFKSMRGADAFLSRIGEHERQMIERLYESP